jgi:2Fe-2S ferredoxin
MSMAQIHIIERDGSERSIDAPNGDQLMEALRDENTGVEGTCGGTCSCGTCHVYIHADWQSRLGAAGEDEEMMLEALEEFVERRPGSRLACQICMSDALTGLSVEIAPAVE